MEYQVKNKKDMFLYRLKTRKNLTKSLKESKIK